MLRVVVYEDEGYCRVWITENNAKKYTESLFPGLSFPMYLQHFESDQLDLRNLKRRKTNMTLNKLS